MRTGCLEWLLAPRGRVNDGLHLTDRAEEWVYPLLTELAARLEGLPWMVVSGLAVPLHAGRFYRSHSDVDIGLPVTALAEASRRLRTSGFVLTRRLCMTHASPRRRLEVHQRLGAALPAEPALRRLRLWRQLHGRLHPERYVDLFPYVEEGTTLRVLDGGTRLPNEPPLWLPVRLPGGMQLPVQTLAHVVRAKARRERPRDRLDYRVACSLLPGEA